MSFPWTQPSGVRPSVEARVREVLAEHVSTAAIDRHPATFVRRAAVQLSAPWRVGRHGLATLRQALRGRGTRGGPQAVTGRYDSFWRQTPDLLFALRVTPGGLIFDGINPAFEAGVRVSSRRAVGRPIDQLLPPDLAALVSRRCSECLAAAAPVTYTVAWPSPAGLLRHWETTLTPLRDGAEAIHTILGASRDVSARQETQIALAQSEERFRTAAELAPNILFTALPDGTPDYLNPRFFAYAGLPAAAKTAAILATVHPADVARLVTLAKDLQPGPCQAEIRLRRADGAYRWFRVRAELVDGLAGPRWHGVASDVHDEMRSIEAASSSDDLLGSVLSSISDLCLTIDREWRITSITPQALAWARMVESDVLGIDARQRLPVPEPLMEAIDASFVTGRPNHVEFEAILRPGRWVEYHVYPFAGGASILFEDVTDRRLALQELEAAKGQRGEQPLAMTSQIVLLDEQGVVIAVNEAWRPLEPARRSLKTPDGVGSSYLELCRRVFPNLDEGVVRRGLHSVIAGRRGNFAQTYRIGTPDGVRWRQMRISRFRHGAAAHFIAIHEDVTEVTRAQTALRETSEQLLMIQDEERHRIAIELHDSTSQHLVALGMGVARLRRTLGLNAKGGPGGVLDEMAGSLREAVKEIRVLSYLMNPPNLGRDGLEVTARQFVRGFGSRTGLHVAFRAEGDLDGLDPALQHTAFRVVQEALSNVYRHAAAQGVEIELAHRAGRLVLRIADDGKGIASIEGDDLRGVQMGVGIPGMRARVAQFGGVLEVAGDGAGTVVSASIPLAVTPPARRSTAKTSHHMKLGVQSLVFGPAYAEHPGRGSARQAADNDHPKAA
jgi:PAS domain S-box-containing protein